MKIDLEKVIVDRYTTNEVIGMANTLLKSSITGLQKAIENQNLGSVGIHVGNLMRTQQLLAALDEKHNGNKPLSVL